jgi:hypothetical protein
MTEDGGGVINGKDTLLLSVDMLRIGLYEIRIDSKVEYGASAWMVYAPKVVWLISHWR